MGLEFEFEVEFEMDIPRQIGVGNNVGMIESVVGNNEIIEMIAKDGRSFGIEFVEDVVVVDLLVRKG